MFCVVRVVRYRGAVICDVLMCCMLCGVFGESKGVKKDDPSKSPSASETSDYTTYCTH